MAFFFGFSVATLEFCVCVFWPCAFVVVGQDRGEARWDGGRVFGVGILHMQNDEMDLELLLGFGFGFGRL